MSDARPSNFDLKAALQEAEERFAAANPRSASAYEAACSAMPGGNTRTVLYYPPFPLSLAGGEGCHVEDLDGHRYVDFVVEQTAGLYGHSNPVIKSAILEALERGITLGGPTPMEAELAELLCARFPALDLVRFTNSGTEANLLALSAARAATGRARIMAFEGCYHGSVLSFGGYGNALNVPFPMVMAPYNDAERTRALIAEHAADLAAVIIEPMTGSGGCIPATQDFLRMLREETERHGIVLIFDEVMTSRLGPRGLQGLVGITPDMMTMGKYLGGGLTFGGFGGRRDIMERFDPRRPDAFGHAGTFNNNVLTMAAAVAGLRHVFTPDAATTLNALGDELRGRLNALIARHGVAGQVTGIGSMMMLHLTGETLRGPRDTAAVPADARALFHLEMIARGCYVARRNMMVLSLPMGAAEFDTLAAAFDDFLAAHRSVLAA